MSLLITGVGVLLGFAYAGLVDRRLDPRDWCRWTALTPFWVVAVGMVLALHTVNVTEPASRAIQAFAFASLAETLIDSLRARSRRRAVGRDERVVLLCGQQHATPTGPNWPPAT